MSEPSLSASIFGSGAKSTTAESSLSNIFDASNTLPEKPSKLNFTEPVADREKREKNEEKKKKRKQKKSPEEEAASKKEGETDGGDDAAPTNEDEERTVFVGNLPSDVTRKSLESMFKLCGKIKSTRIRSVATAGVKVAPEHAGNQVCKRTLHYFIPFLHRKGSME